MSKFICVVFAVAFTATSSLAAESVVEAPTLEVLLQKMPLSSDGTGVPEARFSAIRETGTAYGAQAGLAHRLAEINKRLIGQEKHLDQIYNFTGLMMKGNVIPPVIVGAKDVFEQSSDTLIRVMGQTYQIESQARFTYAAPTWRSYLVVMPSFDGSMLAAVSPRDGKETSVWQQAVSDGYRSGEEQAEAILVANFERLKHDYQGMGLYHQLLKEGKVSEPYVATSRIAVSGDPRSHMNQDEVILRINVIPEFVTQSSQWKTPASAPSNAEIESRVADRIRLVADPVKGGEVVKASGVAVESNRPAPKSVLKGIVQ